MSLSYPRPPHISPASCEISVACPLVASPLTPSPACLLQGICLLAPDCATQSPADLSTPPSVPDPTVTHCSAFPSLPFSLPSLLPRSWRLHARPGDVTPLPRGRHSSAHSLWRHALLVTPAHRRHAHSSRRTSPVSGRGHSSPARRHLSRGTAAHGSPTAAVRVRLRGCRHW